MKGTTSACAENTSLGDPNPNASRNYLRVRGEYIFVTWITIIIWELPPRARRILGNTSVEALNNGTTSACAENTKVKSENGGRLGNYLRVRGEYSSSLTKQ